MSPLKVPHTFEMRPTSPALAASLPPDELMLDWRGLPDGSVASMYVPDLDAAAIVSTAATMYGTTVWQATHEHTLACPARDIIYMPIPAGPDASYAGLLVIELPATVTTGQQFTVNVLQLTSQLNTTERPPARDPVTSGRPAVEPATAPVRGSSWRWVLGTFALSIPVVTKQSILTTEERQLSVLRWILSSVPTTDRNYLTFSRYVDLYADRVAGLGGDPSTIPPSATGTWPGGPGTGPGAGHVRSLELTGKIERIIYDRFGDFEGFTLETDHGEHATFHSREERVGELAIRAITAGSRITVESDPHDRRRPRRIILHA
jgi:hypothetical protein